MSDRYLTKLPPKSENVAPGDVVGGIIFLMDKPVGVEPGMIGISIDSPEYRDYAEKQLRLLKTKMHPNNQLQSRFNKHISKIPGFTELDTSEQIDVLLNDKVHIKRRYPLTGRDLKKIFLSFGKYHEVNAFQPYYQNVGAGGLLLHHYRKKLKINPKDHFVNHIQKMIDGGNKVYMVKQDASLFMGRAGPNISRLNKTEVGKGLQTLLHPGILLLTGGLSGLVYGIAMGAWRWGTAQKPAKANDAAIVEEVATQLASIRGFDSQEMRVVEGKHVDGSLKIATMVTWSPGCRDLSGKLAGGESDKTSVVAAFNDNGQLRVNKKGDILCKQKETVKGKDIIRYEKILSDGTTETVSKKEYQKAKPVSEDRIAGLGESLISFLSMGDRDGIGELGQNKMIRKLKPPKGKFLYSFFGIDFGKAYEGKNPIIQSLNDDFSVVNPTARKQRFLNISMLYDTPLREKMKGVYLLAVLRNKLSEEEKEKIARDYELKGDAEFAKKLRSYPESLFDKYGENIGMTLYSPEGDKLLKDQQIKKWVKNGDLWWIKNEENKYRQKAQEANDPKMKKYFITYADRLGEVYNHAQEADNKVLAVFDKRMHLTPTQIDILDNLEKLTAHNVNVKSPDGEVYLNHIRVERADRVPWQLIAQPDGTFTLQCEANKKMADIKPRLNPLGSLTLSKLKEEKGKLSIQGLSVADLQTLSVLLTEDFVAANRAEIKNDFRTKAKRMDFHDRFKKNKALSETKPAPSTEAKVEIGKTWQQGSLTDSKRNHLVHSDPNTSPQVTPNKSDHVKIGVKSRKSP